MLTQIDERGLIRTENYDLLFDYNENTLPYFDDGFPFPEYYSDRNSRGVLDIIYYFHEAIDNSRFYGGWGQDDAFFTFGFKNGNIINTDENTDGKLLRKNIFAEKNLMFAIWDGSWGTYFWFDGTWEGLVALNNYTGWFDLSIYDDSWI